MAQEQDERIFRIGEVYFMKFGGSGSEQSGWRPGLVFQNNKGNSHSPNIIALPLTSCLKKAGMPTHVVIGAKESGLPKDSMVLCENPERMSKERVGDFLTVIPDRYMEKIAEASLLATSAISFINPELLPGIWKRALELNRATA